jgi:alkanesulfonate monooxygenase
MTLSIYWRLDPTAEPRRSEPAAQPPLPDWVRDRRVPTQNRFDYYLQVADAAAQAAFDGLFVRHRLEADESRIIAAIVARAVRGLTVVPEFPASVGSAVYAAKQATTFQRSTGGRLGWAITPDADVETRAREADTVAQDELTQRLDEFLTVARGVHEQRPFSFKGAHFEVLNGGFDAPLSRVSFPTVFLQGEDEEALRLSARHSDVHLFVPAPVEQLAERIAMLATLAAAEGRTVAAGLIQPLLVREDSETAWCDAVGLPDGTLVGSYDEAAAALAERHAAGISHLLLEATPTLEETYRVGQHLLPRLRALTHTARRAA